MKPKVVSFDIFQTLVDVNQRIPQIWQGILEEKYTKELGEKGAQVVVECYSKTIQTVLDSKGYFYTMDEVYMMCANKAVDILGYQVTPRKIVDHLLYQHSKAPFFEDSLCCIQTLKKKYKLVLCSDSNHRMVDELIPVIQPSATFISDDLHSYKASKDQKFFAQVISKLDISPNEMIHIGDSSHDIIGAHRAGIPSVWLNRKQHKWNGEYKPDVIVSSLHQLEDAIETLMV